ncbi:MAG: hypothetical protein E6X54_10165 [Veillonella parvula]|nr:hypothetical protein [Veillonella parvula]
MSNFGMQFTGDGLFYVCKSFGTVNCFQLSSSGISKVFAVHWGWSFLCL